MKTHLLSLMLLLPLLGLLPAGHAGDPVVARGGGDGAGWVAIAYTLAPDTHASIDLWLTRPEAPFLLGIDWLDQEGATFRSARFHANDIPNDGRIAVGPLEAEEDRLVYTLWPSHGHVEILTSRERGDPERGTLLLWWAGHAESYTWRITATPGATVHDWTSGNTTYYLKPADFHGTLRAHAQPQFPGINAGSVLVEAEAQIHVTGRFFGIFELADGEKSLCLTDEPGCGYLNTHRVHWTTPTGEGWTVKGRHKTYDGAPPGAYTYRLERWLDPTFSTAHAACAPKTCVSLTWGDDELTIAGADVHLPTQEPR